LIGRIELISDPGNFGFAGYFGLAQATSSLIQLIFFLKLRGNLADVFTAFNFIVTIPGNSSGRAAPHALFAFVAIIVKPAVLMNIGIWPGCGLKRCIGNY
jgi:hypothetical protein